jgi:hypothetical protein
MTEPTRQDDLVARYHAAQAELDADPHNDQATGPSPQVRANVLAYAAQLANQRSAEDSTPEANVQTENLPVSPDLIANYPISTSEKSQKNHLKPAANDSQWKIRAMASIAIFGLSGLLFMQWDRAPAEDQEIAFGNARPAPPTAPPAAPAAAPVAAEAAAPSAASPPAKNAEFADAAAPKAAAPAQAPNPADKLAIAKPPTPAQPAPASAAPGSVLPEAASAGRSDAASKAQTPQRSLDSALAKAPAPEPLAETPAAPSLASSFASSTAPMAARARPSGQSSNAPNATKDSSAFSETESDKNRAAAKATGSLKSQAPSEPDSPNAALFAAIRSKDAAALALALQNGADKNAKASGTPALTLCVQTGQLSMVRQLLSSGADINALDAQGVSALTYARRRGFSEIAAVLEAGGAR